MVVDLGTEGELQHLEVVNRAVAGGDVARHHHQVLVLGALEVLHLVDRQEVGRHPQLAGHGDEQVGEAEAVGAPRGEDLLGGAGEAGLVGDAAAARVEQGVQQVLEALLHPLPRLDVGGQPGPHVVVEDEGQLDVGRRHAAARHHLPQLRLAAQHAGAGRAARHGQGRQQRQRQGTARSPGRAVAP